MSPKRANVLIIHLALFYCPSIALYLLQLNEHNVMLQHLFGNHQHQFKKNHLNSINYIEANLIRFKIR